MKSTTRAGGNSPRAEVATLLPEVNTVEFEYLGDKTLIVMGQSTRQQYRFVGRGARLLADVRDRVSLSTVPGLREVTR